MKAIFLRSFSPILTVLALSAGLTAISPSLWGQSSTTWNGSTSSWTLGTNWTAGAPYSNSYDSRGAVFNGQGVSTIENGVTNTSLNFDAGDYTINFTSSGAETGKGGNVIGPGVAQNVTVNAGTQTFNGADFTLTNEISWNVTEGTTLTVSNNLSSNPEQYPTVYFGGAGGGDGTINLNGNITGGIGVAINEGIVNFNGQNDHTNGTAIYAGTITINGSVASEVFISGGTLTINGSAGSTVFMEGGTVIVNGTVGGNIGASGMLGGTGTINSASTIYSGGTLAPGEIGGTGVLTFGGSLHMDPGANIALQINGAGRGSGYDGMDIGSEFSYAAVDLALDFGSALVDGSTFYLFNSGSLADGSYFNEVNASGFYEGGFTDTGGVWTLENGAQTLSFDQSSGILSITGLSSVPEPATYATWAGAAMFGVVVLRRRGKRRAIEL